MMWVVFFVLAAVCFLLSVTFALLQVKSKHRNNQLLDPSNILFAGVVLSAVFLFIPIYLYAFKTSGCGIFESILIAVHNMIRLFIVDGEFNFILANLADAPEWIFRCYTILFSVLFVLAPLLTFSFVLSFFKNASAYKQYLTHFNCDVYIFSELSDRSLTLVKSLYENGRKRRFFMFADVFAQNSEQSFELIRQAGELGAVCFRNDIAAFRFSFYRKRCQLNFFTIGSDQSENTVQALKILENFHARENTNLYVFSTLAETEVLLANAYNKFKSVKMVKASDDSDEENEVEVLPEIKVRRINEIRSLINRTLYMEGYDKIFGSARAGKDGFKHINAVVLGMGQHGTEMTKALAWFCQMDGYRVEINSFDLDKRADDRFRSLCPELMSPELNGRFDVLDEAKYKITVHPKIDVNTKTFDDILLALPRTTYVFVALGDDETNIAAAIKLRSLLAGMGYDPVIHAVVYDSDKKVALDGSANHSQMKYSIDFIGDFKTSYSEEVVLASQMEAEGLERHKKWGTEYTFWQYDFNYKSSVASAIHRKMKILCKIPGIEKTPTERSEEELWQIRILEHSRWNAYMRSEGFVYSGSIEKSSRNNLAKKHNCLVRFYELPLSEQIKDDD